MKNLISTFLACVITSVLVYKYTMWAMDEDVVKLQAEIRELKIDMQYNETETYSQCQRFMQINAKIQRVDGCMRGVEVLCNERAPDKAAICMKSFMPVCDRLDQ